MGFVSCVASVFMFILRLSFMICGTAAFAIDNVLHGFLANVLEKRESAKADLRRAEKNDCSKCWGQSNSASCEEFHNLLVLFYLLQKSF